MAKTKIGEDTKREKKAKFVRYERINAKAQRKFESLLKNDKNALAIFKQVSAGNNVYIRESRKEDSKFDLSWIKNIEDTLPHVEKIIEHPKISTKTTSDVVPLELSKKINSESVQHLASHAQFVKTVDKNGNVTPEKLLNIFAEDEYNIYENRMVATLIRHLIIFLGIRYNYLNKNSGLVNYETLYVKNVSEVNGCHLEVETKIKFSRNTVDKNGNDMKSYLDRIKYMVDLVSTFNHTSFMKNFTKVRDVHTPLLRTNIIRKNPDYRACAALFSFLNSYNKIGINFTVHEDFHKLSKEDEKYLSSLNVLNFLSMNANPSEEAILTKEKEYEPKVLVDDKDLFYFENYKDRPVFVRADDAYFKDIEKQLAPVVKEKPTKEEIAANKAAYKEKKRLEAEKRALLELKKRKDKARKEMLKEEARQEKAEAEELRKKEEALKLAQEKEAEEALAKAREHIVSIAKNDAEPLAKPVIQNDETKADDKLNKEVKADPKAKEEAKEVTTDPKK